MTKEELVKRITEKYNKIGDVIVDINIKSDNNVDHCTSLVTDDNEICLMSENGGWVYPITELTKRELESVLKNINLQNRLIFIENGK